MLLKLVINLEDGNCKEYRNVSKPSKIRRGVVSKA
jgi:hypothetical protein